VPHTGPEATLDTAEFLRALAPERRAEIAKALRERPFRRQELLFLEGHAAESVFLVRAGRVRLCKYSADGRVTTLDTLGPGEVFGALSATENDVYPAAAEALTAGSASYLPRSQYLRLLAENPALGVEIVQIMHRRLRDAHDRLRAFAHDPAPARLARELLRVAGGGSAQVTRRTLAEAAGTTVETAIRVLRRFEEDGWIRGAVGRVAVLDATALRRLAGEE
jgi:CRP/FNR family transcriptional regulator